MIGRRGPIGGRVPVRERAGLGAMARRPGLLVGMAALAVCFPVAPIGETTGEVVVQTHPADVASAVLLLVAAVPVCAGVAAPPRRALVAFGPLTLAAGIATLCSPDIEASLPGFLRVAQLFVLVPLAVMVLVRDRRDAVLVVVAVVVAVLAEACYGIWQARTGNGASIRGETVRAVGTFGAGDVMALSIVAGFGVVITLAFLLAGPRRARPYAVGAMIVLSLALVLALSRGSWIATVAAAVLVLLAYSRRLAFKTAVTVAALLVVAVGGLGLGLSSDAGLGPGSETLAARTQSMADLAESPDQSVVDRYSLWAAASGMLRDHPFTGVGVKNFAAYRDTYAPIELSAAGEVADPNGYRRQALLSPHNEYMLFLAEQGLVGLAGLLALFGTLLYGLCARWSPRDPLWLASAGFLAGLLINFLYADLSGPSSVLVAIMIGLAAAGPSFWHRPDARERAAGVGRRAGGAGGVGRRAGGIRERAGSAPV